MARIIRAERPDGSRIPVDLDTCIEHPLSNDGVRKRILHHKPAEARPGIAEPVDDLWVYQELVWGMSVRNNRPYRPQETQSECRIVTREEARKMFREAGKDVPPELSDDAPAGPPPGAAGPPPDLRPYRHRDGGVDTFDPSDCPPEHRFHAFIRRWDEFLFRVPRTEAEPAWIWWRENLPGWPVAFDDDRIPSQELSPRQAAVWFSEAGQKIPPILAEDLARERTKLAASPPAAGPDVAPARPADPRDDAPDPAIQAAVERLLSDHAREVLEYRPPRPRLVLPEPESITLARSDGSSS